ncbi:MAG: esterase, partial [Intestinibacter sp.]
MREFKLYLSGILYAYVYFENDNTFVKELDVFTNKFLDKEELSSEKNQLYTAIYKIDLKDLGKKITDYDKCFSTYEKYVVTPFGERYEMHCSGNFVQRDVKFPNNILFEDGRVVAVVCPSREYVSILVED